MFAATIFALLQGVTNGFTAVVIVQAGIFAEANRQLVRVAAQLELDFNSVERVVEYLDVAQEAPAIDPCSDSWWLQGYNRPHYEEISRPPNPGLSGR